LSGAHLHRNSRGVLFSYGKPGPLPNRAEPAVFSSTVCSCEPLTMIERPAASRLARGGKALYGAPLGILMLEARFPRIPGDMGNATTWPFPALYRVGRRASPERVVLNAAAGLLDDFLAAAAELVADGAEAITTNCGFLSLFQA